MSGEFTLAVHALVYLLHKGTVVSSRELADNICTNPARVRKVLSKLHKAGLVTAQQGKGSGYRAMPGSGALSLDKVTLALEAEPVALHWRSGDLNQECLIASGMGAVMTDLCEELNRCCLARMSSITVEDVSNTLFAPKEVTS